MDVAGLTPVSTLEVVADNATKQRVALLGMVSVAIATSFALVLVPYDPSPPGALFNAAWLLTIGILIAPMASAVQNPKSLLRAENILAIAPIYWLLLDPLQSAYPLEGISSENVNDVFLSIGLFEAMIWIGVYGTPWRLPKSVVKSATKEISKENYFYLSVVAFALGMLPFAIPTNFNVIEMFSYLGNSRWNVPWGRGLLGGWEAFQDQLQYFGYLLPALTVIVARDHGWTHPKTLISAAMSVVVTLFLMQGGGRRILGMIIGMALILWILTQQKLRIKHVLSSLAIAALMLATMQVMVEYRGEGLRMLRDRDETSPLFQMEYLHVDDNFLRLSQIVNLIPDYYPYVYHKYVVWVLVRPIPRVFWPGKPIDPGFDLPSAVGVTGASLSSSLIGELYMSAGFLGVGLGGWFFGRLSKMASQLLTQELSSSAIIIYAILTMSLFIGFRSMIELVLMNYALVAWVGLSVVYLHFRRLKGS